jgi:protein SCO1/2
MKHLNYFIVVLLLAIVGCKPKPAAPDAGSAGIKFYYAHGVVRQIATDRHSATIQHNAIAGYMLAMTMEFPVKDTNELNGIAPSDEVTFKLAVGENEDWIEGIRFISHRIENVTNGVVMVHETVPELKTGDLLPDCELADENGGRIRFSDFRGRALAFTFFFTRCPLPDYCPRMSKKFSETRQLLLNTPDAPTNWQFLSISFDPDIDQPEMLASYAKFFRNNNPDRWRFAAASTNAIAQLAPQLDLMVVRDRTGISHNLRTVVLDPQGRIAHQFDGNEWTPQQLATALTEAAGKK